MTIHDCARYALILRHMALAYIFVERIQAGRDLVSVLIAARSLCYHMDRVADVLEGR